MGFGTKRVDYWPDHYAFLNVEQGATLKEISHAIRDFRAAVHPDQNRRANEEMKLVLERLRKHLDEAEEVLIDTDGLRVAFDDYRAQHPERIATVNRGDGVLTIPSGAVTPLNPETMNLDALLSGKLPDFNPEMAQKALRLAGESGGNTSLAAMREAHKALPDNAAILGGYKSALADELMLTSVALGGAWQSAGASSIATNFIKSAGDPYRPLLSVEETIQDVTHDILPNTIQQRANALLERKTDRPLLLPAPDKEETTALMSPTDIQVSQITQIAQNAFLKRTKQIKEAHSKRAQLIQELLALSETFVFCDSFDDKSQVMVHILVDVGEGLASYFPFLITLEDNGIAGHDMIDNLRGASQQGLLSQSHTVNSYGIVFSPEVGEDIGAHLYHVLHKYGYLSNA